MIDDSLVQAHRQRALSPDHPPYIKLASQLFGDRMLVQSNEERAKALLKQAQEDVRERWQQYQHLSAPLQHESEKHEYDSIALMKGSMSQRAVAEPAAFERAN